MGAMSKKVILVSAAAGLLVLLAGGAFVATWDVPPPTKPIEKVLPDAQFPR